MSYRGPLVFASANPNKIAEMSYKLKGKYDISGLLDIQCHVDLPETGNRLEDNARQKARYVWENFHVNVFADDTGLEVEALDGLPGVNTAFFGGPEKSAEKNMSRLLHAMNGQINRKARFRTVICLIIKGDEYLFEGCVDGEILSDRTGTEGFGYDPIFRPHGSERSFAQMSMEEKNSWSHRGRALEVLSQFLEHYQEGN